MCGDRGAAPGREAMQQPAPVSVAASTRGAERVLTPEHHGGMAGFPSLTLNHVIRTRSNFFLHFIDIFREEGR